MTRNQLPDGVGKKIVEALKRQQTEGDMPVAKANTVVENNKDNLITENELEDFGKTVENVPEIENLDFSDDFIIEDDSPLTLENENEKESSLFAENNEEPDFGFEEEVTVAPVTEQPQVQVDTSLQKLQVAPSVVDETPVVTTNVNLQNTYSQTMQNTSAIMNNQINKPSPSVERTSSHIKIPYNVAILNNLIATLPAGVNRQVGAQIIRQTLEATGLSMTGVLKEAQELQEQLNGNSRECLIKIQELKTNIMQMEKKVQDYQRQTAQINDLISLFLLTDKK